MRTLAERMTWLNPPPEWGWSGDTLWVRTAGETDLWQRTHYGFRRDNAHALAAQVDADFRLAARFHFEPTAQYDQCGLVVRADADCWFKCSVEFENERSSRLGSVVTNHGWSDWATQDIPASVNRMSFEVVARDGDLLVRASPDGRAFEQMRIAHLVAGKPWFAGIYGCSPTGTGFRFEVTEWVLE